MCVEAPQPDGRRLTRSRPCDANGGVKIGASRHRLPAPRAGLGAGQDSAGTREALEFSAAIAPTLLRKERVGVSEGGSTAALAKRAPGAYKWASPMPDRSRKKPAGGSGLRDAWVA